MSALVPFLSISQALTRTLAWTIQRLTQEGFPASQTFDLQIARADHMGCTCPHHRTRQCSCRMVILLRRIQWPDNH